MHHSCLTLRDVVASTQDVVLVVTKQDQDVEASQQAGLHHHRRRRRLWLQILTKNWGAIGLKLRVLCGWAEKDDYRRDNGS